MTEGSDVQVKHQAKTGLPCWRIEPFPSNEPAIELADSLLSPAADRLESIRTLRWELATEDLPPQEKAAFADRVDIYLSEIIHLQQKTP